MHFMSFASFAFSTLLLSITLADAQKINDIEFAQQALMAHNAYRRIHGVPDLTLNSELTHIATTRAHEMANVGTLTVKTMTFQNQSLGESVGAVGGFLSYNGLSATELWYSVLPSFDSEGEASKEGASFTQMVWKNSREVGFGIVLGADKRFYFAAEYFPRGNKPGEYEANVFQLSSDVFSQTPTTTTTSTSSTTTTPASTTTTTVAEEEATTTTNVSTSTVPSTTVVSSTTTVESTTIVSVAAENTTLTTSTVQTPVIESSSTETTLAEAEESTEAPHSISSDTQKLVKNHRIIGLPSTTAEIQTTQAESDTEVISTTTPVTTTSTIISAIINNNSTEATNTSDDQ